MEKRADQFRHGDLWPVEGWRVVNGYLMPDERYCRIICRDKDGDTMEWHGFRDTMLTVGAWA